MIDTFYGLGGEVTAAEALADAIPDRCPLCDGDLPLTEDPCPTCRSTHAAWRREMLGLSRVLPEEEGRR